MLILLFFSTRSNSSVKLAAYLLQQRKGQQQHCSYSEIVKVSSNFHAAKSAKLAAILLAAKIIVADCFSFVSR